LTGDLDELVRRRIEQTLAETSWDISESARRLGLTRTQLYGRLKKYQLERPAKRHEGIVVEQSEGDFISHSS
jgi:DNA-binding NtrC family response regulator